MARNNQTSAQQGAAEDKTAVLTPNEAEQKKELDPKTAINVLKGFSASENGCTVDEYAPGLYESLPPVASKYAIAVEAVSKEDAKKLLAALVAAEKAQEAAE